jgi:PAS domain S-box-containing protein
MEILATNRPVAPKSRTLDELQVHRLELELQNEELLQAQGALEKARLRYFDLYREAPVGYCLVTEDHQIVEANSKVGELLGVDPEALVEQPLTRFIHWEDQDVYYLGRRALFKTGEPQSLELRLVNQGQTFWAHFTMTLTQENELNLFRLVMQDISRRKAAEDTLSTEMHLLEVTLRSVDEGVITTDAQGAVLLINRKAEMLCGWTQTEALGQPLGKVFGLDPCRGKGVLATSTGKLDVEVSRAPLQNPQGQEQGQVLVFRDVTEQLKLQGLLQQAGKIEALGVQAGVIAHDFSDLLGGIFGYLVMARNSLPDADLTLEYIGKAEAVFSRAKTLTTQLMTFSKGGPPRRKTGQLGPLLRGAGTFVLMGSNLEIDYNIDEDLSPCDFDGAQISQVISNLLLNAKQALPLGGILCVSAHNTVLAENEVGTLPAGSYVLWSITNQGEGLGMSTCQSLVEQHSGALELSSEPGRGTVARVYLPATQN